MPETIRLCKLKQHSFIGENIMFKNVYLSLVTIALVLALVAGGTYAFFSNTKTESLTLTTAGVKVGQTTGFPLTFDYLVPGVWTDWKETSVVNDSNIKVDLYTGLKDVGSGCDLIHPMDLLTVHMQIWDGDSWESVYYGGGTPLFGAWQKVADDMPAGGKNYYRTQVLLDASTGNDYQNCTINNHLFIHAVQWEGGSAPTTEPWKYTP
jgi:predicted ribosomally synthesized peptide with SipW-like signal peptide